MIIINKKKGIFKITQIWFAKEVISKNPLSLLMYKQALFNKSIFGFIMQVYNTVEIDLTQNEEKIFNLFSSNVKNEIRRCQKELIQTQKNNNLNEFINFFNDFAKKRGLPKLTILRLTGYDNYYISDVLVDKVIVAKHMYLIDGETQRARLLHSPSLRFTVNIDKGVIGRANKYLHYMDMLYFKDIGLEIYDFGGISTKSSSQEMEGINKFKRSFGSNIKTYYDYYSIIYYLMIQANKVIQSTL